LQRQEKIDIICKTFCIIEIDITKMKKKNYNIYTSFSDRFPFIALSLIIVFAIIIMFQFKIKYPMPFFSDNANVQVNSNISYTILVTSPNNKEVFNFVNKNDFVPIEVRSRQIEGLSYKLNIVINDKDTIKTFNSSPYSYDWKPLKSGEYTLVANLIDGAKTIPSSNKIKFYVNKPVTALTAVETIQTTTAAIAEETLSSVAPTIKLEIFEGPTSVGDGICYYRIRAMVAGNPTPMVSFSKDDSGGAWGSLKAQINLTKNVSKYTLTAIAKNSSGLASDAITLNWDGQIVKNQ
jgi:hypothetical protein